MNECYICTDVFPPLISDVCMCKNRFVHLECQKKLVATLEKEGKCGVCKVHYRNVTITVDRHLSCQFASIQVLNAFLHISIIALASLVLLQMNMITNMEPSIWCFRKSDNFRMSTQATKECVNLNIDILRSTIGMVVLGGMCIFSCVVGIALIRHNMRLFPRYIESRCIHVGASSDCCTRAPDSASLDAECTRISETRNRGASNFDGTPECI